MSAVRKDALAQLEKNEDEIINEFKVVAENIHRDVMDVMSASQDAVSLLNNQVRSRRPDR